MADSRPPRKSRDDRHMWRDAGGADAGDGELPIEPRRRDEQQGRIRRRSDSGFGPRHADSGPRHADHAIRGQPHEEESESRWPSQRNDPRTGATGRSERPRGGSSTRSRSPSPSQSRPPDRDRPRDVHGQDNRTLPLSDRFADEPRGYERWDSTRRTHRGDGGDRWGAGQERHREDSAVGSFDDRWQDDADEWDKTLPSGVDDVSVRWSGDATGRTNPGRSADATRPPAGKMRKRAPWSKRRRIIVIGAAICIALCLLVSTSTAVVGAMWYSSVSKHLKSAETHLTTAESDLKTLSSNPFNSAAIASAHSEFQAAHSDFVQLQQSIGQVPGFMSSVPRAGSELDVARQLVPVGVEGTQAGVLATQALGVLATDLKNPFDTKSPGVTPADISTINQDVNQIYPLVQDILAQLTEVAPSDVAKFSASAGKLVASLRTQLPQVEQTMTDAVAAIKFLPTLLGVGQQSNIFLTLLDSAELRPGGGFIGSYGFATLQGGHIANLHFQDIDLLDRIVEAKGLFIPLPSKYQWFDLSSNFGVRDSNMEPDFATDMQIALSLYDQEVQFSGGKPTQPVAFVSITPYLIQSMLKITGPITLPEYNNLVITANNLIYEIHYHQLTPGVAGGPDTIIDPKTGTSLRKEFTGFLFKHFMDAVKAHAAKDLNSLIKVMLTGIQTKDVQIASPTPAVQKVLSDLKLDSTVRSRSTGDTSFIVDANISGNKANYDIVNSVNDQVTLDANGNATHHMSVTYVWPDTKQAETDLLFGLTTYRDYLRLYLPQSATLSSVSGWSPRQQGTAYNDREWAGFFSFLFPGTHTVTFTWTVPHAAVQNGTGWTYDYLIQHQAGWTRQYTVTVTAPTACKPPTATPLAFKSAGAHGIQSTFTLARDEDEIFQYQC